MSGQRPISVTLSVDKGATLANPVTFLLQIGDYDVPIILTHSPWALVREACGVLHLNNRQLGDYLGVSRRTIQRYIRSGQLGYGQHFHKLAIGVHPTHPELAAKLARAAGTTLEELGLRSSPPKSAPATPTARSEHADSVVCAAADVLELHPAAVRPAIAAALSRMRALGLSVDALRPLLDEPQPK
jgi:hypothetical protein